MRRRTLVGQLAALGAIGLVGDSAARTITAPARPRRPRIGYLSSNASTTLPSVEPFFEQLRDLGYVRGSNVDIDVRMSEGEQTRLPAMAAALLATRVDVLVASGGPAHYAAAAATRTVPLVLIMGPEPVQAGFVSSFAHPGGNATGIWMNFDLVMAKKLELLRDLVPGIRRIAALYRSDNTTVLSARYAQRVAPNLGLEVEIFGMADPASVTAALAQVADGRFDGLIATSILTAVHDDYGRIPEFAARQRMPICFGDVDLVRAGGLMHYTSSFDVMYRDTAMLVDKILKGARPAELPVVVASRCDLAVNFSAAERIGLRFPSSILLQATEVVP